MAFLFVRNVSVNLTRHRIPAFRLSAVDAHTGGKCTCFFQLVGDKINIPCSPCRCVQAMFSGTIRSRSRPYEEKSSSLYGREGISMPASFSSFIFCFTSGDSAAGPDSSDVEVVILTLCNWLHPVTSSCRFPLSPNGVTRLC